VAEFWSIERSHHEAKTIAQAGRFVEEAERLFRWASLDPALSPLVRQNEQRIRGGLEVFAARRLIDAGEHREAVRRLWRATRHHPPTVVRYWYKVVQAIGSAAGLGKLFEAYRSTRRRLQYRGQTVSLDGIPSLSQPAGPAKGN
jgi:hypothetical protein